MLTCALLELLFISTVTPHQSTLSLFTMVKQTHLLSEEQLKQIKESEFNEDFDQCYRPTLKRCSPSREAFGSPVEKFSKTAQDIEIENSSEDGVFFSQEETNDNYKDASRIYADQEVPVQDGEVPNNSTGQAMDVLRQPMCNPFSEVGSFGDRPSFNSESNNLEWLSLTGDHLHIGNSRFYEEPKKGQCTKSFGLKCSQRHHGNLLCVNSPEKQCSSAYGVAEASSMNAEQEGGELTRLADQLGKNSEILEKQEIMMITNKEDPSHNKVQVMLSQSSVTHNVAYKYPPLHDKAPNNTGLCLSLHVSLYRDYSMENALYDFNHSLRSIRKLTRSLRSLVRFLILLNS